MRSIGVPGAKKRSRRPPIPLPASGERWSLWHARDFPMKSEVSAAWMGRALPRLEDATLLRGAGRFVDDIALPGLLHACFVRSPVAHARLHRIDTDKARALPGVHGVLNYQHLHQLLTSDRLP